MSPADLAEVLRPRLRAGAANERELQEQVARALGAAGVAFARERALSPRHRPDFMVAGIAVELKVSGSPAALVEQIIGYLDYDGVIGALIVSTRLTHRCPPLVLGKPVALLHVTMLGVL